MFKKTLCALAMVLSFATVSHADTFYSMDQESEYYEFNFFGKSYVNYFSKAGQWETEEITVKNNWIYANNGKKIFKITVYDENKIFINGVLYIRKH